MEIRHSSHPLDAETHSTEKLRQHYLVETLFENDELRTVYTHEDRVVLGGAVPKSKAIKLDVGEALHTAYFLERREIGIVNIGGRGMVSVNGEEFTLERRECLYVGRGNEDVMFHSLDAVKPARFYLVSALAHTTYPTQKTTLEEADHDNLGSDAQSNKRTLYRFIHANGIQSCQLMLGMTVLKPNNMWNTMPAHLHDRRMEAYLYFDLDDNARVFHFMGRPDNTRHMVVQNEQAVISPGWSIHSGVGTSNYTFIWAMAGENYTFTDMDPISMEELR